jgi:uncharacterized protein YkwD
MEGPATRLAIGLAAIALLLSACATHESPVPVEASNYFGPPIVLKPAGAGSSAPFASPTGGAATTGDTRGVLSHTASVISTESTTVVSGRGANDAKPEPNANPTAAALAFFNQKRAEVGLPAVAFDAEIAHAASEHAHYLTLNGAAGHDEVEGRPGFTGIDATARVRRHTDVYGASEVLSVFNNRATQREALEQIFDSPYHRGSIFFDWVRGGAAMESANRSITVVDFADIGHALADNELIAWPRDGQTDVPASWTDNEVPDPLGPGSAYRGQDVGYPITLSGGASAHIDLRTLELRDDKGHLVPCHIAPLTAADSGRNTAVCTPYKPLASGTVYTVHATGRLSQISRFSNAPFALDWHFTTRASGSYLHVAGQGVRNAD